MRSDFDDLTGKTFGRWTVIAYSHTKNRITYFLCSCSCGTKRTVNAASLRSGRSGSCGCLHREMVSKNQTTHGFTTGGETHPLYTVWAQMISRCYCPTTNGYARYGGRGIRVCKRWRKSFENFLTDIGQRPSDTHTLDRFPDNNGNYEPGNVRWATKSEQNRNKRNNRLLTYDGETRCIQEWAEHLGICPGTIYMRLKLGWSAEETLTTPIHPKKKAHVIRFRGETLHIKEWAKRLGVSVPAILHRLKNGWTINKALTTPCHTNKIPKKYR